MIRTEADVTPAVLAVMEKTHDPRLRGIMVSLIKHLHGFIRDVRLTEPEFRQATMIINQIGQCTTDTHNEAVLMAGSLGASALVCLLNNGDMGRDVTSQNLLGPFWRMYSPATENGGSIVRSETPGDPLEVHGVVSDRDGNPVVGAEVDIWHASPSGFYENQDPTQADMNLRGKFTTDEQGRFWFTTIKMSGYPVPTDGVVGTLLAAQGRHPFRPAHLHVLIAKPGFKTLISQIYDPSDPHIDSDVQFGVTEATTGRYVRHDNMAESDPVTASGRYTLDYRFVMESGEMQLPKPPIK